MCSCWDCALDMVVHRQRHCVPGVGQSTARKAVHTEQGSGAGIVHVGVRTAVLREYGNL